MRTPHFVKLAEIDEIRSVSACRHGLVHLTWGRTTVRFSRDEFRRLAGLLARARDTLSPSVAGDPEMQVTYRPGENCEVRVGAVVLLLSADEYAELYQAAQEAVRRLDEILRSGMWDREEEGRDAPADFWEPLRRTPFSQN